MKIVPIILLLCCIILAILTFKETDVQHKNVEPTQLNYNLDSIIYQNIWMHGAWYGSKNTYNIITTGKGIDRDSAFADDYNNFKNKKYD